MEYSSGNDVDKTEQLKIKMKIWEQEELIKKANTVKSKIEQLSGALATTIENMRLSESAFQNGGYYVSGETPGSGQLLSDANSLEGCKDDLDDVIKKIDLDIAEYRIIISAYKVQLIE